MGQLLWLFNSSVISRSSWIRSKMLACGQLHTLSHGLRSEEGCTQKGDGSEMGPKQTFSWGLRCEHWYSKTRCSILALFNELSHDEGLRCIDSNEMERLIETISSRPCCNVDFGPANLPIRSSFQRGFLFGGPLSTVFNLCP